MNTGLIRAGQGSSQNPAEPQEGHLALHTEMASFAKVMSLTRFSPCAHLSHSCYVSFESCEFSLVVFAVP